MSGLSGLRVIERGETAAAAFAGKLLADLGADVVKIEPRGGDPLRRHGPFPGGVADAEKSGLFLYLNTNKKSVVLEHDHSPEELTRLAAGADLWLTDLAAPRIAEIGIEPAALRAANPRLVVCSMTPFGLTGPYRDYRAYELNVTHGGGWGWLSPGASDRADLPPLKSAGLQAEFQGGLAGVVASLAACLRAGRSGAGETIDLSTQAFVASFLEMNFVHYTYGGRVASRLGRRMLYPWGIYPCVDGAIFMVVVEPDQWTRLKDLMGNPEWAEMEIFADAYVRAENWDALKPFLDEWTQQWKVADLWHAGQAKRICLAPTFSMEDLAAQPQLEARGFFVDVDHPVAGTVRQPGPPYQLGEPWWQVRRPAPRLGQHTQEVLGALDTAPKSAKQSPRPLAPAKRPLDGIRVVDLSWAWAGPFCAMHLAHLGAEVIKVESAARLDLGRRIPIFPTGLEPGPNRSGYFNQWGQGKKSVLLNLQDKQGLEALKRLISRSDVVLDNFATGVMERLGLGTEELHKLKPDLIAASISGYGHSGPQKEYMAYGPAVVQLAGIASLSGYRGEGPSEVGISYGDPNGGIHAAVAITAALYAREQTGRGQSIDVSLWDSAASLIPEGWMEWAMNHRLPERIGNRHPQMAPHECFRCAGEDEWVTIACGSDDEWRALAKAIGHPALGDDPRFRSLAGRKQNEDELEAIIGAWTAGRTKWDVTRELQAAGVAAFPSMNSKDLADDPHLNERGFFSRLEHAEVGARVHTGIPWQLETSPGGVVSPAPLLGADTDRVLADIGYSEEEIATLRSAGALA